MKKRWIFLFLIIAAVTGVVVLRDRLVAAPKERLGGAGDQAVSVVVAKAQKMDVPVWLSGIGTVEAYNTVTVRPRASGSLDKVNFTEGSMVEEGDVLAEIDSRPYRSLLAQAEAKKNQDMAQLANARVDAERLRSLLTKNAVSRQEFDQAEATVAQLEALVEADIAIVEAAQLDLDFTLIRAPIAGMSGMRLIDSGNLVTANQEEGLVVLTQLQPVSLMFTLPQRYLQAITSKMREGSGQLVVHAVGDDGSVLDEGVLVLLNNQIDASTGTLRLKATFKNELLSLWPGQFASARLLVDTRKDAVVIPAEAVMEGLDGQFCYIVKADQTVEPRQVKPGLATDGRMIIEEGLEAGETVVISGQGKLKPGVRVEPQDLAS